MPNRTPMAAKKRKASRLMPGSNTGSVSFFDAVWWLSGADSPRGSASWLQARVSDCQTAFKAGSDSLFVHLGSVSWSEEAGSEQIELCAAVHLALHELQPGDLPFGLSVRPRLGQGRAAGGSIGGDARSEEHPSELQSLMRNSYA